jgi:hypothetical protein
MNLKLNNLLLVTVLISITSCGIINKHSASVLENDTFSLIRFSRNGEKAFFNVYNEFYNYRMLDINGEFINYKEDSDSLFSICKTANTNCYRRCFDNYCDSFTEGYLFKDFLQYNELFVVANKYPLKQYAVELIKVVPSKIYVDLFEDSIGISKYFISISFNNEVLDTFELISSFTNLKVENFREEFNSYRAYKSKGRSYYLLLGKLTGRITSADNMIFIDVNTNIEILHKDN